ncbi:adenylate/guanylate cyclase domain-containing protein [Tropicibacter sp. Alg240-R139]|uniref:adenylate/guanylate cyclase domain-containing protein n=1 Tax=Tropicibacter sp. Alg240-R139 TaxID=2305991 RepID=UPI0013DEDBD7|nr:tetratricopeptide repeat protein [Tropicibacter sp. Alg240-R139]
MTRRLATILAADAVGFSTRMEKDEEETFLLLKSLRQKIDTEIETHGGRVFGSAGDSVVAEFASPVEAVRCALRIQTTLNLDDLPFRIGVHIGDVLVDGDNLMGDGVNVAARLEQMAPTGGICLSKPLADLVVDKIDATFSFAGDYKLKNIKKKVGVWVWPQQDAKALGAQTRPNRTLALMLSAALLLATFAAYLFTPWTLNRPGSGEPTLAVMAFEDQSPGTDHGYLSDAISEGILNNLSRYTTFKTIARNSSFKFKGQEADLETIRDALGADLILNGSQQKIGEKLAISVQLIDAITGDHLWSERFEGEVGQLFEFQGEIIRSVASTVGGRVSHYTPPKGTRSTVTAMHLAAEGFSHFRKPGQEANARAVEYYKAAIHADPEASIGYMSMGFVHWAESHYASTNDEREADLDKAEALARQAISLDSANYLNHYLLGRLQESRGNLQAALQIYDKVKQLNPSYSNVYRASGSTKVLLGDIDGAIADIQHAIDIDPLHDWSYNTELALAYWADQRCGKALQTIQQVSNLPSRALPKLAVIQVCAGKEDMARETMAKLLEAIPNRTLQFEVDRYADVWTAPGALDRWLGDLRTAGMPD